jgi:acyl carrier protein
MISKEEFIALLRDDLGIPVSQDDLGLDLDVVPGWDSVHLLWLLTLVERRTGRSFSLPDALEASSLSTLYAVVAA